MTFYERVHGLCDQKGMSITKLATILGFSASATTTWKNMVEKPKPATIKKIADYFEITIDELNRGVEYIDYNKIDTSSFNRAAFEHLLEKYGGNEKRAIKAYLEFEKAEAQDAMSEPPAVFQNNGEFYGMVGDAHAPVKIINGKERNLTDNEREILRLFSELNLIEQSKVIVYAAELKDKK